MIRASTDIACSLPTRRVAGPNMLSILTGAEQVWCPGPATFAWTRVHGNGRGIGRFSEGTGRQAQTGSPHIRRRQKGSRSACDRDAREVTTVSDELKCQPKRHARLALDEDLWPRARRATWPGDARLDARQTASGAAGEVDLVGSGALQRRVRSVLVMPGHEGFEHPGKKREKLPEIFLTSTSLDLYSSPCSS